MFTVVGPTGRTMLVDCVYKLTITNLDVMDIHEGCGQCAIWL